MSIEKHDLMHELPEYCQQIHEMKVNNRHFARLFENYHHLDREVRKIEEADNTSDAYIEERKK